MPVPPVLGGSDLSCLLPIVIDLRRTVDFSVHSAFYLLLGGSDEFQGLPKCNWKPEVFSIAFRNDPVQDNIFNLVVMFY